MVKVKGVGSDPFLDHEEYSKKNLPRNKRYRMTKNKFVITEWFKSREDQESVHLTLSKSGELEIKIRTFKDTHKTDEFKRCNFGHKHPVIKREEQVFILATLDVDGVDELKKFLSRQHEYNQKLSD